MNRTDINKKQINADNCTRAMRDLMALNAIALKVSQTLDLDTVLESALDKTLEAVNKNIGGILILDEDKQILNYAAHRGMSENYVKEVRCHLGEGIAGRVAQSGKAIVLEEVLTDMRLAFRPLVKAERLKAFASIPIISKGKVLGVMNVASHKIYKFPPQEIRLLNSIASQIAIAIENAQLHQEVRRQDVVRGELLRDIYLVQEEERKRIARELHDETSQTLTSLSTTLEAAIRRLPSSSDHIKTALRNCQSTANGILGGIHRLIYELRPTLLDDLGLAPAIRWLADTILKPAGLEVTFAAEGKERRLPSEIETTIFRVIQEALHNIVRHSKAKNVRISLTFKNARIQAKVIDDGTGFDVNSAYYSRARPSGLGLLGMRERVELVGGKLSIESDTSGTTVSIDLPLNRKENNGKDKVVIS